MFLRSSDFLDSEEKALFNCKSLQFSPISCSLRVDGPPTLSYGHIQPTSRALAEGQHLRKLCLSVAYLVLCIPGCKCHYTYVLSPLQDLTPSSHVAFTFVCLLFFFSSRKEAMNRGRSARKRRRQGWALILTFLQLSRHK